MNLKKLGQLLKEKREDLGLSLRKAAELINISHNYLSILEKANDPRSDSPIRPTIDTLKLISDAYKIDINELLKLAGYDIIITNAKDKYSGKELADLVPEEWREAIQEVEYFEFYKKMKKEEINPDDLIEAYKVYKKIKEDIEKKNKSDT